MTIPEISPLKLEGKDLCTYEKETTVNGRKEFQMRQVLHCKKCLKNDNH